MRPGRPCLWKAKKSGLSIDNNQKRYTITIMKTQRLETIKLVHSKMKSYRTSLMEVCLDEETEETEEFDAGSLIEEAEYIKNWVMEDEENHFD